MQCFIIQPFDDGKYDARYYDIIQPAIERCGLYPYRVDLDPNVDIPIAAIEEKIRESCLCISDITENNPNVWYETGYACACGKKMILMACKDERTVFPFDIRHRNLLLYSTGSLTNFQELSEQLAARIRAATMTVCGPDGVYTGKIVQVVKNESRHFTFYRLERRLDLTPFGIQEYRLGETHWIADWNRLNEPCRIGDTLSFSIQRVSEPEAFPHAACARTITPRSLCYDGAYGIDGLSSAHI